MQYYFAPLEGVTGSEFRRAHHRWFPGVDAYYMPFLSPTQDHVFTQRELRNVLPEHNQGFRAVPQLLTKNADDFLGRWWPRGRAPACWARRRRWTGCWTGSSPAPRWRCR